MSFAKLSAGDRIIALFLHRQVYILYAQLKKFPIFSSNELMSIDQVVNKRVILIMFHYRNSGNFSQVTLFQGIVLAAENLK